MLEKWIWWVVDAYLEANLACRLNRGCQSCWPRAAPASRCWTRASRPPPCCTSSLRPPISVRRAGQIPANENARKSQQGGTVHWASKAQGAAAHWLEPAHGFHGVVGSTGHRIFQSLVSPPVILHHFYLFLIWYLKCFTFFLLCWQFLIKPYRTTLEWHLLLSWPIFDAVSGPYSAVMFGKTGRTSSWRTLPRILTTPMLTLYSRQQHRQDATCNRLKKNCYAERRKTKRGKGESVYSWVMSLAIFWKNIFNKNILRLPVSNVNDTKTEAQTFRYRI